MKLTRKGFQAWLESKNRRQVVGYRYEDCSGERYCPLAQYLRETFHPEARVGSLFIFIGVIQFTKLPRWAMDFVNRVDRGPTRITAARALKYLEGKR